MALVGSCTRESHNEKYFKLKENHFQKILSTEKKLYCAIFSNKVFSEACMFRRIQALLKLTSISIYRNCGICRHFVFIYTAIAQLQYKNILQFSYTANVYRDEFVTEKISTWIGEIELLSEIAKTAPQEAFTCFTAGYKHKLNFTMRTIPNIQQHLQKLDEIITTKFIPAITSKQRRARAVYPPSTASMVWEFRSSVIWPNLNSAAQNCSPSSSVKTSLNKKTKTTLTKTKSRD